jgi:hypothetical protein
VFAVSGNVIVKSAFAHCSFFDLTGKTQKLIDRILIDKTWIFIYIFVDELTAIILW